MKRFKEIVLDIVAFLLLGAIVVLTILFLGTGFRF